MKLRISFLPICAMLLLAGALFTSCTQTNTPNGTVAYTDTWRDMPGLTNGTSYQFSVTGSSSNTVITGVSSWTSGTVRVFWTRAAGDTSNVVVNDPVGSTASANTIVWAPADNTSRVRLFETADLSNPSGLILGATSIAASTSGSQASNIDLVLATTPSINLPQISLQSANVAGSGITNGKVTQFAIQPYSVKGGLAMQQLSASLSTLAYQTNAGSEFADIVPTPHDSSSVILIVHTADNHYARIEIIPQPSSSFNGTAGNYLWGDTGGTSSRRFIDVNVSYQTAVGVGFAGRPGIIRRETNTPRTGTGIVIGN